MRLFLQSLPLATAMLLAVCIPARAAPHQYHTCPTEARGSVSHHGEADWVVTPQSSRLTGTRIAPIGGIVALVCVYQLFGSEFWIYKRPAPDYVNCVADARGFYCRPS